MRGNDLTVTTERSTSVRDKQLKVVEICAGAGGQALGLESAGFQHKLAVEIDRDAANTLRLNRPGWDIFEGDVRDVNGLQFEGVDLLAGGVPCPPFSLAGKQLGAQDERDLFPEALRLVEESRPRAVMLENVRGFASRRFDDYREEIVSRLLELGYESDWRLLYSSNFGIAQLRPRFILVAFRDDLLNKFTWPSEATRGSTVGDILYPYMAQDGWLGAERWRAKAQGIAPTIVGGSKKHGGADLGPTRAKKAWLELGVDGKGIADSPPQATDPVEMVPRLTNQMVARIQGFPEEWAFSGKKTSTYRQIGNALPPALAAEVGRQIAIALEGE